MGKCDRRVQVIGIFNDHKGCQQLGDAGRNLLLMYVLGKQHGPGIHIHDNAGL